MPTNDLINLHFTPAEMDAIDAHFAGLEAIIRAKARNISPEERIKYGSINEQNKLVVNKIRDYRNAQPSYSSPDVDWVECEADWQDRTFLDPRISRIDSIKELMVDTKILHDYDNYQNALVDYNYSKYKSNTDAGGGYDAKVEEIKQFFPNTGGGNTTPTPPTP